MPQNPLARPAADPWAGKFEGEGLVLELRKAGDGWGGTITLGAQQFPVEVKAQGQGAAGTFRSEGVDYPLALAQQADGTVALETAGTLYALKRAGATGRLFAQENPENPLTAPRNPLTGGAPPPAARPAPAGNAAAVPADWQTFKHPLGFQMRYPAGWQLRDAQGAILVVPPDLAMEYGQPAEAILISGEKNAGVTGVDDPRLAQYVDAQMQRLVPGLTRKGPAEPLAASVPAGTFTWTGKNPQTGAAIEARVHVVLFPDAALFLTALGKSELVARRDPILRQIAGSFEKGEAQRDPALVGSWRHTGGYSSNNPGTSEFSSVSERYLGLAADGTATSGSRLMFSSTQKSGGEVTARGHGDTGDPDTKRGTWMAGSGRVYLQWPDGYEEYKYEVSGGSMLLTPDGGKPKLYERVQ